MTFDKKAYMKAYTQRPEYKLQRARYRANPKNKLAEKEYAARDETKERRKELYALNKETEKAKLKRKKDAKDKWEKQKNTRDSMPEDAIREVVRNRMWYSARARARKNGLEFDLNKEDICFGLRCPLLDVEFTLFVYESRRTGPNPHSPSIDRIDNSKGYVKGNIRVICYKANVMKHTASLTEFLLMAENWKNLESKS